MATHASSSSVNDTDFDVKFVSVTFDKKTFAVSASDFIWHKRTPRKSYLTLQIRNNTNVPVNLNRKRDFKVFEDIGNGQSVEVQRKKYQRGPFVFVGGGDTVEIPAGTAVDIKCRFHHTSTFVKCNLCLQVQNKVGQRTQWVHVKGLPGKTCPCPVCIHVRTNVADFQPYIAAAVTSKKRKSRSAGVSDGEALPPVKRRPDVVVDTVQYPDSEADTETDSDIENEFMTVQADIEADTGVNDISALERSVAQQLAL